MPGTKKFLPAVLLAGLVLAAGCGQAMRETAPRPDGAGAALGKGRLEGPGWYAVQLHAHSTYSDGVYPVKEMIRQAKAVGLDALGISDHDTSTHWLDPDMVAEKELVMLRSMEAEDDRGVNHMGYHGMKGIQPIPHAGRDAMLKAAADRGATIVIHHPANRFEPWDPLQYDKRAHAIEIWNSWFWVPLTGEPGEQPHRQDVRHNERAIAWWAQNLARGEKIAPIAASDFHRKPQSLGSPCTMVYAEARNQEAILAGIRAGRTMLVDTPRSERVELTADSDGDGRFEAMVGDTASAKGKFRLRVTGGKGRHLLVMRGEQVIFKRTVPGGDFSMEFKLTRGDAPFVYARLDAANAVGNMKAMSAPIYLKP